MRLCCCIPMKDFVGCQEVVKECVSRWTSAKKATKTDPAFQNELNTLLDLRLASCQTLFSLKATMKSEDNHDNTYWNIHKRLPCGTSPIVFWFNASA